jgi:hypothetical protein
MLKRLVSLFGITVCISITVTAQKTNTAKSNTDIVEKNSATHIVRITKDSLIVLSGSTYSFTVDTPEDQGLVPTKTTVQQLLEQITSKDRSVQTYKITDKEGITKKNGDLANGDHLVVNAPDKKDSKIYYIATQSMAIGGWLRLEKNEITVNTNKNVILYFTAGQRSPNTTVRVYLPEGIHVTPDNTTVNVIGRGDVKLKDLATQSMGRLGSDYRYKKVGNFGVAKNSAGGSILLLK